MIKVKEDLTGRVFGRLTVIKQTEDKIGKNGTRYPMWLCECSCENKTIKIISGYDLTKKTNPTQSCGCLIKENVFKACHKTNKYNLDGEYGIGWATNTNMEFYFDLDDYDKIKDYCWYTVKDNDSKYMSIVTTIDAKQVTMHKLLGYKHYDHINRNALDNRKSNLRPANSKENARNRSKQSNNTSGFIGVSWDKECQKWRPFIKVGGKMIHLGRYVKKEDAIRARLEAELKYFGEEFAPQRHLFKQYNIIENHNVGDLYGD